MRTWSVSGTAFALCTRSSSLSMRTRTSIAANPSFAVRRTGPLGPGGEPVVDLAEPADRDREVAVLLADVGLDARNVLGKPPAVGDGHHQILDALPEERRHRDLVELEPPGRDEGQIVVPPALDPVGKRMVDAFLRVRRPVAREDGSVDRRQDGRHHLFDLLGPGLAHLLRLR